MKEFEWKTCENCQREYRAYWNTFESRGRMVSGFSSPCSYCGIWDKTVGGHVGEIEILEHMERFNESYEIWGFRD